ncbi:MAG: DUF2807 domain-containing protein [Rikenellaceae bacterium]|jgi:hypothetical protein|nr:DUF2807 domain-containing protein [Rikenellaceae bacterium]
MKKTILLVSLFLAVAAGVRAQQLISGENITDFNTVSLSGQMSVEMIPSDKPAVAMELHGVNPNQVTWGVTGSTLSIKVKPAAAKEGALIVRIYYTKVQSITAVTSDVRIPQPLESVMFSADISSGAKFTAALDCLDAQIKVTGNSAAQIEGRAKYVTLEANQRSKIDARTLEAQSAGASSYMASEIYAWGAERMISHTNTGGAVFYKGDPAVLRVVNNTGGSTNGIGN